MAVELPNALDFSRRNKYEGPSSALDLDNFVVKYTAQQIKQKNTRASKFAQKQNIFLVLHTHKFLRGVSHKTPLVKLLT